MPVTPHDLGLHKLLKLFSPLVRPVVNRAATRRLRKAVNIEDVRRCAEKRVHNMCFGYLVSGGDDEVSLRRNHDAYTQLEMHFQVEPRVLLCYISCLCQVLAGLQPPLDLSTKLFGHEVGLPFFTCPTAGNKMFHNEGEMAVARAAAKHSSLYCLSSLSTTTIEELSTVLSPQHPKLFQIYVWRASRTSLATFELISIFAG